MRRKVTHKIMSLLLAVVMCVSLSAEFSVNAEEVNADTVQEDGNYKEGEAGKTEDETEKSSEMFKNQNELMIGEDETFDTKDQKDNEELEDAERQDEGIDSQELDGRLAETEENQGATALPNTELKNPRIVKDSSMKSGQKVTWDCVWFGSYPQSEVKSTDGIYSKLQSASGWDDNNDITIDGNKYRRMRRDDATGYINDNYYKWTDSKTYHYFKWEPIKWRVLKTNKKQALLLSDVALDDQKYHTKYETVTWETSTIRSWLNGYDASVNKQGINYNKKNFINSVFTFESQQAIENTYIVNQDNIYYRTMAGNNTTDKIFLLSDEEIYGNKATTYGFINKDTEDEARKCKSSTYTRAMGALSDVWDDARPCPWWLRTPGVNTSSASRVSDHGYVFSSGWSVDNDEQGVRPALNLDLSSSFYNYAGTVCSDGTVKEVSKGDNNQSNDNSFNLSLYKAKVLSDMTVGSSEGWRGVVNDKRICELLVDALEDRHANLTMSAWKAIQDAFSSIDNPSNIVDINLEEHDIYEALLFSILSNTSSNEYLDLVEDIETKTSDLIDEINECAEIKEILGSTSQFRWNSFSQETKEKVLEIIKDGYSKTKIGKTEDFMNIVGKIMSGVNDVEEAVNYIVSYVSMRQLSDAVKKVVKELYEQCPSSNKSLKYALKECYQIMTATNLEFVNKMINGTVKIVGKSAMSYWVSVYWGDVKDKLIAANPNLLFFVLSAGLSTYASNILFNTDETVEEYFDMVAMDTLFPIAKRTYNILENRYKNSKTTEDAEIYLNAAKVIYRCIDADCSYGANYVATLDESAIGKLQKFFGETTIADTKKSIENVQESRKASYGATLTGWIFCLEEDGYASELPKYEKILTSQVGDLIKSYQIACPVDVYVYDKNNRLVATVINNMPKTYNDGVTVVVEGDIKTLYFTRESKANNIQYKGTGKGTMDIIVNEYKDKDIVRTINFNKLGLEKDKTYTSNYTNNILDNEGYTVEISGQKITPNYDSTKAEKKYKVSIENGILMRNGTAVCTTEAEKKEKIEIVAYVPKGYKFIGWSVSSGKAIIEDSTKEKTYLHVDSSNCSIHAEVVKVNGSQTDLENGTKISKIKLSGISKKIAAGKKIKLTASIAPSTATNKALTWQSSNKKVATVNNSGVVTMKKNSGGKSVIITAIAQDGSGVKAKYKITSMKGIVKKISISGKKSVWATKTVKLKAKVKATKKANKKLKWTSSNPNFATVSNSGKVKTYSSGKGEKVKITAMATDGSGKKKTIIIKIK